MKAERTEATTLEGWIQQLAVGHVARGYHFYFQGTLPEGKDARAVDAKLIERYGVGISKYARMERKRRGLAVMRYLRFGRHFVLLATKGKHEVFWKDHGPRIRNVALHPIRLGGYAVSFRGGRTCVRMEAAVWRQLQAYYLEEATRKPVEWFVRDFWRWPFEPWAPIRRQTFVILNQVNKARKAAGLSPVPTTCVRLKRRIVRPFEPLEGETLRTASRPRG